MSRFKGKITVVFYWNINNTRMLRDKTIDEKLCTIKMMTNIIVIFGCKVATNKSRFNKSVQSYLANK